MNASPKITTMTSREFNQHRSRAKEAASNGPVFITDRGRPAYVLMDIDEYRRITGKPISLGTALAHPPSADIDLGKYLPMREIERTGFDFEE